MAKLYSFPKTNQKKLSSDCTTDVSIAETLERITDVLVRVARQLDACESPDERRRIVDRLTQCAAELRYIALNARGFRL